MGVFGGISEAKYSEGGVYLKPGVFRLQVEVVKHQKTRKGQEAFIVEFVVLESNNTDHPVGSMVTWMVTLDKESALGNIRQFIASVMDAAIDDVDEASAELVISDKQPLKSRNVRAFANNIKTRAGRDFTKVKFLADTSGAAAAQKGYQDGQ